MHLNKLTISNFRNIEALEYIPDKSLNLVIGLNGSGKTSLLEAIFFCCTAKSFRGASDEIMKKKGSSVCRLRMDGIIKSNDVEVEIAWSDENRKQIKIDGVKSQRLAELFDYFHAISVIPQDIDLIVGPPSIRRRMLDLYISQCDRQYLSDLMEYNRVLSQRNALLKELLLSGEPVDDNLLGSWDERLAMAGTAIVSKRIALVNRYGSKITEHYRLIESGSSELSWSYLSSVPAEDDLFTAFTSKLVNSRRRDFTLGTTTVGPHRDDLRITLNGLNAREYLSRGEAKSAALAIKFALFEYLYDNQGEYPILLLDEISSDLDQQRVDSLLSILPGMGQVFLTAAKESELSRPNFKGTKVEIVAGRIQS